MISVDNIEVDFGAVTLFKDVSFVINDRDKIALVGKNGAGKSTLLKILAGKSRPTKGTIATAKDTRIGYLPQVMAISDSKTVFEEAEKAFAHIDEMRQRIEKLQNEMAERTDYDSTEYHDLIDRFTQAEEIYAINGGNTYHAEIEKTLIGLGFRRSDFDRPTSEFSGGWRMRIELAKILLLNPDVLLLDEPTNHLDIESIRWLESFLINKANAVILVSHDRAFINNITNRTIEISCGRIYDYRVKYDQFIRLRKERREQQMRAYENQQKAIAETEEFIERFRYKATKAVQVQSRIKQLEKIDRIEIDDEDNSVMSIKFPEAIRSGNYPVITEGLTKRYGDHTVFEDVNITIKRGEKIALVGKNGEGKSTFVKCVMGEIPHDGKVIIGHNAKIGYFAQNQAQLLDDTLTVYDTIDHIAQGEIRTKIRDILGAFMFGEDAIDKRVTVLSGGERTRLAMIRLLLQPVNLLILDEPTNHLDMRSKDVLKAAIKDFGGTAIIVSHDRDFLDGLVDKVYEFADGHVREYIGGIYDFLAKKDIDSLAQLNQTKRSKAADTGQQAHGDETAGRNDYEERKQLNKRIRKIEAQIKEKERHIETLENELASVEQQLSTPDGASDTSLYEKHKALKQDIDSAMAEWESLNEELTLTNKPN